MLELGCEFVRLQWHKQMQFGQDEVQYIVLDPSWQKVHNENERQDQNSLHQNSNHILVQEHGR